MSDYLSVLIECRDPDLAQRVYEQIHRDTRPLFDEDVSEGSMSIFNAIESVEFPESLKMADTRIWASWQDTPDVQFHSLRPLLRHDGIKLVAGFEIPDGAECADEDDEFEDDEFGVSWYWLETESGFGECSYPQAVEAVSRAIADKLRPEEDA